MPISALNCNYIITKCNHITRQKLDAMPCHMILFNNSLLFLCYSRDEEDEKIKGQ